jgi:hypothetical protein
MGRSKRRGERVSCGKLKPGQGGDPVAVWQRARLDWRRPAGLDPYGATQLGRLASSTNERDRGRGPGAEDRRLAKVGWRSHCWSGRRRRVSYAPNSDSVIFSYDMALGQSRAPIASRMRQYA